MIIIVGIAHSYTSAIAKFMLDNGGIFNALDHNVTNKLPYDKYEDLVIRGWVINKEKFCNVSLYLQPNISKEPGACFFIDDIPKEAKIIYCLRNPNDLIISNMYKHKRGFFVTFNKYVSVYNMISSNKHDTYILMTERIINGDINEAKRLLSFCDIDIKPEDIQFNLNLPIVRKIKYIEYRFMNTIWKVLSKLFKTYIKIN